MRKINLTKGAAKYAIVTASAFMLTYGAVSAEGGLLTAYADEVTVTEEAEAGEELVEEDEQEEESIEESQEEEENEINLLSEPEPTSIEDLRGDSWYLDGVEINAEDGFYYVEDENGDPVKVVDSYILINIEDKDRFVYIDKEGKMFKGKAQWLDGVGGLSATEENENAAWRYINKKGYVQVDKNSIIGDRCYYFDVDGVYTEAKDEFFEIGGVEDLTIYYAAHSGKVATDKDGNKYCFKDDPEDSKPGRYCYIEIIEESEDGEEIMNYELASKVWIGGTAESGWMYVNKNGRLLQNENKIIEDRCCTFGDDFKGEYIEADTFFEVDQTEDGPLWAYCVGEDHKAAGDYSGENPVYYNFKDEEGKRFCYLEDTDEKVTNVWIGGAEDGEWMYTNSSGRLLQDTTRIIGNEFYSFDENYKGQIIEEPGEFIMLEEGENPEETTWGYCTQGGHAAGEKVDEKFVHYYFKKNDAGRYTCYRSDNDEKVVRTWIDGGEESGWMYTNSNGRLLCNTNRIVGGFCCYFDENCKGSYIEADTFFVIYEENPDNPEEDIEVWRYCTSDNYHPSGNDKGAYRFIEFEDTYLCYEEDKTLLSEIWMEDMWINADGLLVKNSDHELIDGKYYEFNNYKYELLTKTMISIEADGETKTYYVDANGEIVKGQFVTDDGAEYYFGEDGALVVSSWIDDTYYVDANGHKVTDAAEYLIGEKLYHFDAEGKAILLDGYVVLEDYNCYYENNQKVTNDFRPITGGSAYFDGNGEQLYDEWANEVNYVDADGFKVVNQKFVDIDGVRYDFDENGTASKVSGYITVEDKNYFYENGVKLVNTFKTIEEGKEAYFGADGAQWFGKWIDDQYVDTDGFKVVSKNYVVIEGKEYNFDANGKGTVVAGFVTKDDGNYYYVQGEKTTEEFVKDANGKVYFGADGKQVFSVWVKKDNYDYYVAEDGYVVTNETNKEIDGKEYSIDADGRATVLNGYITLGENKYYYEDGVGIRLDGYVTVQGEKYYYEKNEKVINKIIPLDGGLVLFDEEGKQVVFDWYILKENQEDENGEWYFADENGFLVTTGYYYLARENNYYFFYEDGTIAQDEFVAIEGGLAYFNKDGMQKFSAWIDKGDRGYVDANGFKVMNVTSYAIANKDNTGIEYYDFDAEGNWSYIDGFRTIDGKDCYLKKSVIQTNIFVDTEAGTFFFGDDGKQVVMDWITLDDKVWYFAKEDGALVKDTLYYLARENKYYHFNKDGVMSSSTFAEYNGQIIYLGSSGAQRFSDWAGNDQDGWRYLGEDGYAIRNTANVLVGDVYYNFDADGYATEVTYTISYELDGGKNNTKNPAEYTGLTETITLQNPTKPGYVFVGWYADAAFTEKVTTIEQKSNGDLVLYAKWELIYDDSDDDDDDDYVAPSQPEEKPSTDTTDTPEVQGPAAQGPAAQTPSVQAPTGPNDPGETTVDEQKGQVNSVTGVVVGATNGTADDGLSHWQGTTTEDGTTSWKMQYADGSYAAGTIVTDEAGNQQEQVAWEKVSGSWYAFGADGVAKDGWVKDVQSDKWYLIDINSGMQTGWKTDETTGKTYFLDEESGAMKTGWHADANTGSWYYLDEESGEMKTGWVQTDDGKWYYLNPSNGTMYANQRTPDGYFVNANGEWVPGV